MAGVPVEIELTIETNGDDDIVAKRKVVTNSVGYVTATFDLPTKVKSEKGSVSATATRGPFAEGASVRFQFPGCYPPHALD
jgi:hypothetical protein